MPEDSAPPQDVDSRLRRPSNVSELTLVDPSFAGVQAMPEIQRSASAATQETMVETIFGVPLAEYGLERTFVLASSRLQSGLYVFASKTDYQNYKKDSSSSSKNSVFPLLQSAVPVLSAFKRNAPFMVIHRFIDGNKFEFCRVHFKTVRHNLVKYSLTFLPNPQTSSPVEVPPIFMASITSRPTTYAYYKGSRIQFSSSNNSTFGSSTILMHVVNNDNALLLIDEFIPDNASLTRTPATQLALNLCPFGKLDSKLSSSLNPTKLSTNGEVRLAEIIDASQVETEVTEDSLVFICMLLVLREQEVRKNHGNHSLMLVNSAQFNLGVAGSQYG